MQNDQRASERLLEGATEEKRKQLMEFLQRRQQFRSRAPHPANQSPVLPAPTIPVLSRSPESATMPTGDAGREPHLELVRASDVPTHPEDAGLRDRQKHEAPSSRGAQCGENTGVDSTIPTPVTHDIAKVSSKLPTPSTKQAPAFGLVVACSTFRHLPSLSDKTKEIANQLHDALVDSHFARFSRRGSKLLVNPSVIEFQDTMRELKELCTSEDENAAFFMCLVSHGARVISGVNEGSYVLFSEARLSSEEELLLTAIHEHDLVRLIHEIPCRNKFLALELCQVKQAKEKPADEAPTILNRVHENFSSTLYDQLVKLELARQQAKNRQPPLTEKELLSPTSGLFNTLVLESCNVKSEAPVRSRVDSVSNFLHRLNDAFHGAATTLALEDDYQPTDPRRSFCIREVCQYVEKMVIQDAMQQNEIVKADYQKQLRTKYELVAEFQDITQTPRMIGFDRLTDFAIGTYPTAPEKAPSAPRFVSATLSSITISWEEGFDGFLPTTSFEVPAILGYHIQIRGDGRACEAWRRASAFQVLPFDVAVREKVPPPTKAVVRGLACDAAFRFRIRARSAGGWGPFSEASPPFRTHSYASVHDAFTTAKHAIETRGVQSLLAVMRKHEASQEIQRECIKFLSRLAIIDPPRVVRKPDLRLVPGLDLPVVVAVCKAMMKFSRDNDLIRHSCLFLGRLAQSQDAWRKCIVGNCEPRRVSDLLLEASDRFASTDRETTTLALWAIARLRGISNRKRMTTDAAARRIQGLYRTRKAREFVRSLASSVYAQMIDPSSGRAYVYNTRTGATSWSMPSFLHA